MLKAQGDVVVIVYRQLAEEELDFNSSRIGDGTRVQLLANDRIIHGVVVPRVGMPHIGFVFVPPCLALVQAEVLPVLLPNALHDMRHRGCQQNANSRVVQQRPSISKSPIAPVNGEFGHHALQAEDEFVRCATANPEESVIQTQLRLTSMSRSIFTNFSPCAKSWMPHESCAYGLRCCSCKYHRTRCCKLSKTAHFSKAFCSRADAGNFSLFPRRLLGQWSTAILVRFLSGKLAIFCIRKGVVWL